MVRVLVREEVECWLDASSDSWSILSAHEYTDLVRSWSEYFSPIIEHNRPSKQGHQAIAWLESCFPADVVLFSGIRVARLANAGGRGPTAYRASDLRVIDRNLANQEELIIASTDMSWCCVFTHEAGSLASEGFYTRDSYDRFR